MKILFPFFSFYPAQIGGINTALYALSKTLTDLGYEIFVLTTNFGLEDLKKIKLDEWNNIDGINVYFSSPLLLTSRIPSNINKIFNYVHPDIVHLSSVFGLISSISSLCCIKRGIPYIWSPHGELLKYVMNMKKTKKHLFLRFPLIKKCFHEASAFHFTSKEELNDFIYYYNKFFNRTIDTNMLFQIANLVSDDVFKIPDKQERFLNFRYILYIGRISRKKNIESLIKAYSTLNYRDKIKLVIAGWTGEEQDYSTELKKLVKDNNLTEYVLFTEKNIIDENKLRLYRDAELFVLPSHSENFGLVVLEAMAQKTPVIVSNKLPWKKIKKRNAGFFVQNTSKILSETIDKFLKMSNSEKNNIINNANVFVEEFKSENIIKKYDEMYKNVLLKN